MQNYIQLSQEASSVYFLSLDSMMIFHDVTKLNMNGGDDDDDDDD